MYAGKAGRSRFGICLVKAPPEAFARQTFTRDVKPWFRPFAKRSLNRFSFVRQPCPAPDGRTGGAQTAFVPSNPPGSISNFYALARVRSKINPF
jgi:hypothetical protein